MKKIVIILLLVLGLGAYLYADVKKPLNINELIKEIEKIQNARKLKNDSLEIPKTINRLQSEDRLLKVKSSRLKPEAFLLQINLISSKVAINIRQLKTQIKSDSFIKTIKGFKINKTLYKRVTYEDIINAQNKIISKRKELAQYQRVYNFLAKLKRKDKEFKDKEFFYNPEIKNLLERASDIKASDKSFNFQLTQEKNYIYVKKGDVIESVKIVEVSPNYIRIK